MSKNKEVIKQESNEVAVAMSMADWGAPQISSQDIIIPKILCMQGLSELVTDDKAKMGDFVDNMTNEIVGNYKDKPMEFIPFHMEKILIVSKSTGSDYEFDHIEQVDASNSNKEYEEVIDGVKYKNEYCMNFYVLRPDDMSLPYIISFKGMSRKSGKILATQMYARNAAAGKVPPAFVMNLAGKKTKNDKGTFIILETSPVRESKPSEINEAFKWYKTVNAGGVKVNEGVQQESSSDVPF
jgi:hypothetical protein